MFKFSFPLLLCAVQFGASAQNEAGKVELYLHRELNGVTEIIDTSFESKEAMHNYLKALPPADLNLKNRSNVRVYRFDQDGEKVYIDRYLRMADSLLKKSHSYRFHTGPFEGDSLITFFNFEGDSNLMSRHMFHFPEGIDSNFFWYHNPDSEKSRALAYRSKALSAWPGMSKKSFQFKTLDEAEKKLLSAELNQKLAVSSPPLSLEDFKIFPNPGDGLVQVSFRVKDTATLKIRVLNAAGHAIFSETLAGVSGLYLTEIDLRNAGKGVYYVYVLHGKKSAVRKLIIN